MKTRALLTLFLAVASFSLSHLPAHAVHIEGKPQATRPEFAPDEVLVKFRADTTQAIIDDLLKKHGVNTRKIIRGISVHVLNMPRGILVQEMVRRLNSEVAVEYAEPNYVARAMETLVPNDERFQEQWALNNRGQTGGKPDADIDAPEAWFIKTGSASVRIAIVDTGISSVHEDLSGKVGTGYNAIKNTPGNAEDDNGHGTHVAGIAAARTNTDDRKGIAGVCWGCGLVPVKVLDENGSGTYGDVSEGIIWAADNGAQIINLSLGGSFSSATLQSAVKHAWERGVLLACAAGNNGNQNPVYPGYYAECTAVAATDHRDEKPRWSSYGSWVDVAAPGVDILSTYPGNIYVKLSGTSMATPHVAGLAGLVFSTTVSDANANGRINDEVRGIIESTCDKLPFPRKKTYWVNGRINAYNAIFKAVTE